MDKEKDGAERENEIEGGKSERNEREREREKDACKRGGGWGRSSVLRHSMKASNFVEP